jgi:TPR repeat protein
VKAPAAFLALTLLLSGCGTYYDPVDRYTVGLRFFDRGQFDRAATEWKPLVDQQDPDAQFRYGWLLWTNELGPNREQEAIDLFRKAADQGQPKALVILGDLYYQSPHNVLWQIKNAPFPKDVGRALAFYLKADRMARYHGEKLATTAVLAHIKGEVPSPVLQTAENEAGNWKPTIVGREPRKLL